MKLIILTPQQCKEWLANKLVNPKSKRRINLNGPTYKQLEKACTYTQNITATPVISNQNYFDKLEDYLHNCFDYKHEYSIAVKRRTSSLKRDKFVSRSKLFDLVYLNDVNYRMFYYNFTTWVDMLSSIQKNQIQGMGLRGENPINLLNILLERNCFAPRGVDIFAMLDHYNYKDWYHWNTLRPQLYRPGVPKNFDRPLNKGYALELWQSDNIIPHGEYIIEKLMDVPFLPKKTYFLLGINIWVNEQQYENDCEEITMKPTLKNLFRFAIKWFKTIKGRYYRTGQGIGFFGITPYRYEGYGPDKTGYRILYNDDF